MPRVKSGKEGAAVKRQFLVHLDAGMIQRVKILAIEQGVSASAVVAQAMTEFLARRDAAATKNRSPREA